MSAQVIQFPTHRVRHLPEGVRDVVEVRQVANQFLAGKSNLRTREEYRRELDRYLDWCAVENHDPLSRYEGHIQLFVEYLTARGDMGGSAINRAVKVIRGYYRQGMREDLVDRNPAEWVEAQPEGDTQKAPGLNIREIKLLLEAAQRRSPRAYALVMVAISTGLRASELASLELDGVQEVRGRQTVAVRRKGGQRSPYIVLGEATYEAVLAFIGDRRSGPLFATASGKSMGRREIGRTISTLGKSAGIRSVWPHLLRVTMITTARELGRDMDDVQAAADHKSGDQTRDYVRSAKRVDTAVSVDIDGILALAMEMSAPQ